MAFLLDTLKNLGSGDEEEGGFTDLNYQIGNTSGMDIGQVPGPLDQRIGRMAQIGGSIMEIQITNPATFQIDRPELMNVIDQLGFEDVTLHGDPNIGFTGAYATRGQGVTGYNIVHRYFKRYLEQMASFKEVMHQDKDVNVGYVNMHASNEQIPPREEQIASDKSLDPFGMRLTEIDGGKDPNIYRNKEFMRLLFDFLLEEQIERYELFQLYTFFENYSSNFETVWDRARHAEADRVYDRETSDLRSKLSLVQTAAQTDVGVDGDFVELLQEELPEDVPEGMLRQINVRQFNVREVLQGLEGSDIISEEEMEDVMEKLPDLVDELWHFKKERPDFGFSYEGKLKALTNHLDYEARELQEPAANSSVNWDGENNDVKEWARRTFAGEDQMFTPDDRDAVDAPPNLVLFERLTKQTVLGRQMEKESTAFFNILPAWMMTASKEHGDTEGWNVPEFIWRNIVVRNSDYGPDELKDYGKFQKFLDDNRENQLNVIAAVGACYLWGHFTQRKDDFDTKAFQQTVRDTDYEEPEFEGGTVSTEWIRWMNRFGIKVNIEAMFGSPGELRRLWRPRDIAVACHAINMEARQQLGDDYDENLVKFTIDMEHTASYGVDPLQELEKLIDNEKEMAEKEEGLDIDPEKPLAKIVKTYHLTKPGWEQQSGHRHGPFA
ncbi:MAG: hypothetical protein ABEJ64_03925, partial [Candidatus Nanohaloarchaea archaeon]